MALRISASLSNAYEFACHSSSCRPPTSGGTGGSKSSGGSGLKSMTVAELHSEHARTKGRGSLSTYRQNILDEIGRRSANYQPIKNTPVTPSTKYMRDSAAREARQRAADKALGRTPSITEQVKAEPPKFRTSGKKVLDSNGGHVGTWTRMGDGNHWEIAVKGGQRSTLQPIKGIRERATSYNAETVSGSTKREALANLATHFENKAADVRVTGKASSVFDGGVKGVKREQAVNAGAIKASHVSISSDGTVKLRGKPSEYKVVKGVDTKFRTRYQVPGIYISNQRLQSFKTQAAAKMAIVKQIRAVQAETG